MTPDLPQVEAAIVEMTNAFRASQNRAALSRNAALDAAAQAFADHLARTGTFSHTADGRQPSQRAEAAGYAHCQVAENLALNGDGRGFETRQLASQAVEGWKTSPGHRRNMLLADVTETGVGVAKVPDKQTYLSVQLLGRPARMKFAFKLRNEAGQTIAYQFGERDYEIAPRMTITHTVCAPGTLRVPAVAGDGAPVTVSGSQTVTLTTGSDGRVTLQRGATTR